MPRLRRLLALLTLPALLSVPAAGAAAQPGPQEEGHMVIHVFVALCDNKHQGIVPVPAGLGDGQKPGGNLYWGAMYGFKTWFAKQSDWKLIKTEKKHLPYIPERLVFKHAERNIYLVADAYDGRFMRKCLEEYFLACAGSLPSSVWFNTRMKNCEATAAGTTMLMAGGNADLLIFVGHNGLMEIHDLDFPKSVSEEPRQAAAFACRSRFFFKGPLAKSGADSLILTTGNMAPEAYSVDALITAWIAGKSPEETREAVARAYHKYQKCGLDAARRLFVNQ